MVGLDYVVLGLIIFFAIGMMWAYFNDKKLHRLGIYPKEKPTMEDVKRLALGGNMSLARRAYEVINGCDFNESKEAVEQIISPEEAKKLSAYPKGKPTMEDVMRLALSGNMKLARRAYRAINGFSLFKAREAVEQIIMTANKK